MAAALPRIGFIGLGVMGMPMARHLALDGYVLTVHDVSPVALERVQHEIPVATVVDTPRAVAAASDIVITMLPSGKEVRDVALGPQGLLEGFAPGSLLLDTSSSEPEHTHATAAALAQAGVEMVDAPVSGAEVGALTAQLVFMVGGSIAGVDRVAPLFDILGRRWFHLGPTGSGHTMKSINNLITAVTFLATAEGLVIGKAYGLDPAAMNDVLNESTGGSWISQNHVPQRVLTRRFDDPFKLDLMVKDVNIALALAEAHKLAVSLSTTARGLYHETQKSVARGSSVSELVRSVEKRTGVDLTSSRVAADGIPEPSS